MGGAMRFSGPLVLTLAALAHAGAVHGHGRAAGLPAETDPVPAAPVAAVADSPAVNPTLAAGLGLSVYPSKGQPQDQQVKDDQECYKWAGEQTGIDPTVQMNADSAGKAAGQKADSAATGAAVGGAARGAVGGAVGGGVVGDAGDGAGAGGGAPGGKGRQAGE